MYLNGSGEFREKHGRRFAGKALAAILVAASIFPETGGAARADTSKTPEMVLNGSATTAATGWEADSEAGPVRVSRVAGLRTSFGASTAIQFSRAGGTGAWAMAVGALRDPASTFVVGKVYHMRLWVRDLAASGNEVGILLANPHFVNRPTEESAYVYLTDKSWRLVSRTFVATAGASADTRFYVALPKTGQFKVQISNVSVRESSAKRPEVLTSSPDRVIRFAGPIGSAPDPVVWNSVVGGHGWGNGELQSYTDSVRNAYVDGNGNLRIVVRKESTTGSDGITRMYSSGRLTTENKLVIRPGSYIETQIRAPVGAGMWPAFWLGGSNVHSVGWPACGELDVMEGAGVPGDITHTAMHMASKADRRVNAQYGWGEAGGTITHDAPIDVKPHSYGVYFDGATVWFFVDRRVRRAVWAADALNSGRTWPFGQPFFIILNVAVSASPGVSNTAFPKVMTVSPISIWNGGVPAAS